MEVVRILLDVLMFYVHGDYTSLSPYRLPLAAPTFSAPALGLPSRESHSQSFISRNLKFKEFLQSASHEKRLPRCLLLMNAINASIVAVGRASHARNIWSDTFNLMKKQIGIHAKSATENSVAGPILT